MYKEKPALCRLAASLRQDTTETLLGYRDWVGLLDTYPPADGQVTYDEIETLRSSNPTLYFFLKTLSPTEFTQLIPVITQLLETLLLSGWVAKFDQEFTTYLQSAMPSLDLVPDLLQLDRIFQRRYPRYIENKSELLSIIAMQRGKNSCVGGALLIDSWANKLGRETVFFVMPKHQIFSDGNHHVLVGIKDPQYPHQLTDQDWASIFENTFAGVDNQPAILTHYFQGHLLTFSRPDTVPVDQWSRQNAYWLKAIPDVANPHYPRFFQTDRAGMILYTLGYNC